MGRILYITFDGITDPLGRSQILPYLTGLSKMGHPIHILSQEKEDQFAREGGTDHELLKKYNIAWDHIDYKNKPPIIQPLIQRQNIKKRAFDIITNKQIKLTHCRSYMAGSVGLEIKRKHGIPFIFDMRGFWADERKEGGLWPYSNPIYRAVYKRVKRLERKLLLNADHIISLTHKGKDIIEGWNHIRDFSKSISVIPCCADLNHFDPSRYSSKDKETLRKSYHLAHEDVVIGYVGSIGTWYMLDEMLDAFAVWQKHIPNLKLFFLSKLSQSGIQPKLEERGIPLDSVRIQSTSYDHVPKHIAMFDVGLFFILPVFSKSASSPVKQGEMLAMGLPVLCNRGVGDTDRVIEEIDETLLIDEFNESGYQKARPILRDKTYSKRIDPLCQSTAKRWFDVKQGVETYHSVYQKLSR